MYRRGQPRFKGDTLAGKDSSESRQLELARHEDHLALLGPGESPEELVDGGDDVVTGIGLKESHVRRAVELSAAKYCSASIMLGKAADITHDYEIVQASPAEA